jgi:clan AA aspartic protease
VRGRVDEYGRSWIEITVIGRRQQITVDAFVDTGFDGWICLPTSIAIQLGLELRSVQEMELADGTVKDQLIFAGEVIFGDKQEEVEIILTDSEDAFVGTGLLLDSILTIDFVDQILEIASKE